MGAQVASKPNTMTFDLPPREITLLPRESVPPEHVLDVDRLFAALSPVPDFDLLFWLACAADLQRIVASLEEHGEALLANFFRMAGPALEHDHRQLAQQLLACVSLPHALLAAAAAWVQFARENALMVPSSVGSSLCPADGPVRHLLLLSDVVLDARLVGDKVIVRYPGFLATVDSDTGVELSRHELGCDVDQDYSGVALSTGRFSPDSERFCISPDGLVVAIRGEDEIALLSATTGKRLLPSVRSLFDQSIG